MQCQRKYWGIKQLSTYKIDFEKSEKSNKKGWKNTSKLDIFNITF
ncbi:hypothetical protein KIS1582_1851 [Cytobacillus firmus]|uniref:Uncharacterized protein n=1 Tax=Cytobacillus firmus TaxID=1399 RepID=A0A800NB94_CYTFI|nr:hypothetical protein KIS1582_1851 [Cytobacillus firmus]